MIGMASFCFLVQGSNNRCSSKCICVRWTHLSFVEQRREWEASHSVFVHQKLVIIAIQLHYLSGIFRTSHETATCKF